MSDREAEASGTPTKVKSRGARLAGPIAGVFSRFASPIAHRSSSNGRNGTNGNANINVSEVTNGTDFKVNNDRASVPDNQSNNGHKFPPIGTSLSSQSFQKKGRKNPEIVNTSFMRAQTTGNTIDTKPSAASPAKLQRSQKSSSWNAGDPTLNQSLQSLNLNLNNASFSALSVASKKSNSSQATGNNNGNARMSLRDRTVDRVRNSFHRRSSRSISGHASIRSNAGNIKLMRPSKAVLDSRKASFNRSALLAGSRTSRAPVPEPVPVIVITDIGADIDDTLALFVMLGAIDCIRIVAIVTSVNNGEHRAALSRGFLRILGVDDDQIEILPSNDSCTAGCHLPETFPRCDQANICKVEETPQRIIEVCRRHMDTGIYLIGIAALTPFVNAMKIDHEGIIPQALKKIYLQGNCDFSEIFESGEIDIVRQDDPEKFDGKPVHVFPNEQAYNFLNDLSAATAFIDAFQNSVPMTFLGKFAAYQVPIWKEDFVHWSADLHKGWETTKQWNMDNVPDDEGDTRPAFLDFDLPKPPNLLEITKRQMINFRIGNPKKFDKIYEIPEELNDDEKNSFAWFDDKDDKYICCHPYDPLLALKMVGDERTARGTASEEDKFESLFKRYYCQSASGIMHVFLGNNADRHSVPNADFVHDVLERHIRHGLRSRRELESDK